MIGTIDCLKWFKCSKDLITFRYCTWDSNIILRSDDCLCVRILTLGFIPLKSYGLKVAKAMTYMVKPWRKQAQASGAFSWGDVCAALYSLKHDGREAHWSVVDQETHSSLAAQGVYPGHSPGTDFIIANPASAPAAFQRIQRSPSPGLKTSFPCKSYH